MFGEFRFKANIPAVSTFRAKYTSANMGGEEGLFDELKVMSPPPTGAQANGIVKPDEVEAFVPQKHIQIKTPIPSLNGDSILVE